MGFYDFALSQLAPSRQYKHYRLDNLMTFDVCVWLAIWKGNKVYEWVWVAMRLKLTHIIIMITAVAIVIETSVA